MNQRSLHGSLDAAMPSLKAFKGFERLGVAQDNGYLPALRPERGLALGSGFGLHGSAQHGAGVVNVSHGVEGQFVGRNVRGVEAEKAGHLGARNHAANRGRRGGVAGARATDVVGAGSDGEELGAGHFGFSVSGQSRPCANPNPSLVTCQYRSSAGKLNKERPVETEPQYEITIPGYQSLGPKPAPCGECDFCVCVEKEADE